MNDPVVAAAALLWCLFVLMCECEWLCPISAVAASSTSNGGKGLLFINDGRYSYSLSFFDPHGKLGQVERANQAAASGMPILVLTRGNDRIVMAAPHVLPNTLTLDSGTSRFARVSSTILISHSGLTADGRVLMTAAQRLAIEHEYVFDEEIPITVFLEEMSLLFQEYTMKEGVRPFGASLIVASFLSDLVAAAATTTTDQQDAIAGRVSQIYRIDPSGSVTALGPFALVNGFDNQHAAKRMTDQLAALYSSSSSKDSSVEDDLKSLVRILQSELQRENDDRSTRVAPAPENLLEASTLADTTMGAGRVVTIKTAVFSRGSSILEQETHPVWT